MIVIIDNGGEHSDHMTHFFETNLLPDQALELFRLLHFFPTKCFLIASGYDLTWYEVTPVSLREWATQHWKYKTCVRTKVDELLKKENASD